MKRKLVIVGAALVILLFSVGLAVFFAKQKEEPVLKSPPGFKRQVLTKEVSYQPIKTNIVAYGRVETAQLVGLLSEVSGRMFEGKIKLKVGKRFNKGDLLFYIDDSEAALNLKAQKSNFLRDLAAILPDLKTDFSTSYPSWQRYFNQLDIERNFLPIPRPRDSQEKTFIATKGIYSSYYAIKSTEKRLSKYRYYAPFSGSITDVNLQSGAFVNPGVQIGKIIRTGHHELKVSINPQEVSGVTLGLEVKVYDDKAGLVWSGKVSRVSDFVNPNTQFIDVFISISPNGKKIYTGQFFRASIPAKTIRRGMLVPRNIIYNGNEVFVLQDSLLKVETVNVLRLMGEQAIFNGLNEGIDLVVEPILGGYSDMVVEKKVKNGLDVRPEQDRTKQ